MKSGVWKGWAFVVGLGVCHAHAQVLTYGDKDLLGTGSYASEPTAGATLVGLAPGSITFASLSFGHSYPFAPSAEEFAHTDQIYTSANQTAFGDGYSSSAGRLAGPQVLTLDYASLVPAGLTIATFTLGIAADDFQFSTFGQPFTASINGAPNAALTNALNGLDQTGPRVQFFSVGLSPAALSSTHALTLTINQNGDGRDGWAVDFLTIGVTLAPVPEAPTLALIGSGIAGLAAWMRRRRMPASLA